MKKTYLLLTLLCSFLGYSQFNESAPWMQRSASTETKKERSIDEITTLFNEYWKNHDKNKRGSGYKPFMRWENHWRNKTNADGTLLSPDQMWSA